MGYFGNLRKGRDTENKVKEALRELSKEGYINRYITTDWRSEDDKAGIDFWVFYKDLKIPLQVKSSDYYREIHHDRHNNIPCVIGTEDGLKQKIKQIVRQYAWSESQAEEKVEEKMEQQAIALDKPIQNRVVSIEFKEGKPVTTSLNIAETFGKEHFNILQSIKNLECSEEFSRLNFQETSYKDSFNREQKMYYITRDGFSFLVMGFTGKQAAEFKEKYIKAFNDLEQSLLKPRELTRKEIAVHLLEAEEENEKLRLENKKKDTALIAIAEDAVISQQLSQTHITYPLQSIAKLYTSVLGLTMGPNQLIEYIRTRMRWVYRRADGKNIPYAWVESAGYMVTAMTQDEYGGKPRPQARYTGQGVIWGYRELCKEFNIPIRLEAENYLRQSLQRQTELEAVS